ncbi:hypothetical protein P3X46_020313 [Hevea brasiliensis]|uniref:Fibronectin type III-like domain-containing protein n=1 Tax=Hevea brasiliensis TaxID=3981 RepID=A0ABQ9LLI9_HEVBR|nr:hypothetical protein P3X46_020313 [Hevea brasiliensis]
MTKTLDFLLSTYLFLSFLVLSSDAAAAAGGEQTMSHGQCMAQTCPANADLNQSLVIENATPTGSNFTFICDPLRKAQIGIDMSTFAFCDKKLPYPARARDLVGRMTLSEKVTQLGNNATALPRLGLTRYDWWSEALHGMSNVGPGTFFDNLVPIATSFPTVILTTASFNEVLWKSIGEAVSTEARAAYNLARGGLTYWSPTINVVRDPRWGRITETPGEDPLVVGTYAANYVRGLQDIPGTEKTADLNSRPLKVSACCKHYTAYDVDNWQGVQRYSFDAKVTEQDMVETFNRPFEMCVKDGDASSLMCSYNRVNGIPTCADPKLLNETVRGEWNLHGYIVADCDSVEVIVDAHKWMNVTNEEAVGLSLRAGLDLDCGVYYTKYGENATKIGKVEEADIDKSLVNLYVVLMRLGYFDGNPTFNNLGKQDMCTAQHIELATEAARQGIVLLKNDNDTLPLSTSNLRTLAVVGPHGNASEAMIGNYAFDNWKPGRPLNYAPGCVDVQCKDANSIPQAVQAVNGADATILIAGLDLSIEAEGLDRNDLLLPGNQVQLINQVVDASKGPVILVMMCAGGVDINFAKNNTKIKAILWVGYPGEEGGRAIADVVFGKYNPGGRLPITWYQADYINNFPMTSMQLRPVDSQGYPGRTYRFFTGPTVFPFGHGLSYTKFAYQLTPPPPQKSAITIKLNNQQHCRDLEYKNATAKPQCAAMLINELQCKEQIQFDVEVQNVGSKDGDEVILVYSSPPADIAGTHIKQVIGFKRISVPAGKSQKVPFSFNACTSLMIVDVGGSRLLASGVHTITIGDGLASFLIQVNYN